MFGIAEGISILVIPCFVAKLDHKQRGSLLVEKAVQSYGVRQDEHLRSEEVSSKISK